jgi:hypothetical protein
MSQDPRWTADTEVAITGVIRNSENGSCSCNACAARAVLAALADAGLLMPAGGEVHWATTDPDDPGQLVVQPYNPSPECMSGGRLHDDCDNDLGCTCECHRGQAAPRWSDIVRALRAAGWIHSRRYLESGRDEDGAPWDDGGYEHTWTRDPATLTVYTDFDDGEINGYLSFWPDGASGDDASIGAHHRIVADLGPTWLLAIMGSLGILRLPAAPRVWAMPEEPGPEVTRVRDIYGQTFTRDDGDEHGSVPAWLGDAFADEDDIPDLHLPWKELLAELGPLTEVMDGSQT